MSNDTQQIVSKAWNFAHVLRDDGLSYMAYTEQITFLLFLKMADEMTKPASVRCGCRPGDETDEEIEQALKEVS
jgi:type I restriction-modification system DNA methylase subunit